MEVLVYGSRVFDDQWEAARRRPKNELPKLTPEQQMAAKRLSVSDEEYARHILAQQLSTELLLEKTASFGKLLEESIRARGIDAAVGRIRLNDLREVYEVDVQTNGRHINFNIDGKVVEDLLERGSGEAEASISRIIDLNLGRRVIA